MSGKKHSDEARAKISKKRKGMQFSEEHKKNLSKSLRGNSNRKGKTKCKL